MTTNTALLSKLWEAIGHHSAQIAETGNRAPGEKLTGAMAAVEAALTAAAAPKTEPVPGIVERLEAALKRIDDGHAIRRIPADPTDPDLVLAECKAFFEGRPAPFWVKAEPVQSERVPLTEEALKRMHHEDQFGLFCDYDEFEQIARAIEAAHGIQPAHKEQS